MEPSRIFNQLFEQGPYIYQIPGWTRLDSTGLINASAKPSGEDMRLAIAPREDSAFHFFNDSYQSHISSMVSPSKEGNHWYSPMESLAQAFLKDGQPIRGYNLYLVAQGHRKQGKTYELLLKAAMAIALNEIFALALKHNQLTGLVLQSNKGSVCDSLFLKQIFAHTKLLQTQQYSKA